MLKITLDDRELQESLSLLSDRNIRFAAKHALDATAYAIRDHVNGRMAEVFDRPVKRTQNAFRVKTANTNTLQAEVLLRDHRARLSYLQTQEAGGPRPQTALERQLDDRLAYSGIISAVVPAPFAKLNAYGNWDTGERNQALSAVQAQRDSTANTTKASRKRHRKRAGFFVPRSGSSLPAGIWKRDTDGTIYQVLRFARSMPVYEKRLGFYDEAENMFAMELPGNLRAAIASEVTGKLAHLAAKAAARSGG